MTDTINILNILLPLLVVLLLNWLLLQSSSKPLHKLNKSTRKQLRKICVSTWHKIWASTALFAGSATIFVFLHLTLFHLKKTGLTDIPLMLSYLPGVGIGIVVLASGHASLIYCNIDALIFLLSDEKARSQKLENSGEKTEDRSQKEE